MVIKNRARIVKILMNVVMAPMTVILQKEPDVKIYTRFRASKVILDGSYNISEKTPGRSIALICMRSATVPKMAYIFVQNGISSV